MATDPVPVPTPVVGDTPTPTPRAPGKPPKAPTSSAKAEIKIAQDMVNHGVPMEAAIAALNAIRAGEYADTDAYFAAHPYTPVTTQRTVVPFDGVAPTGPDYVGYPNLRYAYLYLAGKGLSGEVIELFLESMISGGNAGHDAMTVAGFVSPRQLMNVPAARLIVA